MKNGRIGITKKGLAWHRSGHPWIYSDDLEKTDEELSGRIVSVADYAGKFLGKAFYNHKSKIALRFITTQDIDISKDFWAERIKYAIAHREKVVTNTNAYRIAHAEADYLPSLIIDKYGGHLAIQTLSAGMDEIKDAITEILIELLKPESIVARNDTAMRTLRRPAGRKRGPLWKTTETNRSI